MGGFDSTDRDSIHRYALRLERLPLDQVALLASESSPDWDPSTSKGAYGRLFEAYFGIEANSDAGPDFPEAGIELKAVPMIGAGKSPKAKRKSLNVPTSTMSSKERTVITMINYPMVAANEFEDSTLDLKTRITLYIFFHWGERGAKLPPEEQQVLRVLLHDRTSLDLSALRTAYRHVQSEVQAGRAHLLSEGATNPVGACTKARDSKHLTAQPFSETMAKPRAFAWRSAYTSELYVAGGSKNREPQVKDVEELVSKAAERLMQHAGVSAENLRARLTPEVSPKNKSFISRTVHSILEGGDEDLLTGLRAMNISVKTARVDPDTKLPHESTSFSPFSFTEVHKTSWDESDLLSQLGNILFVVFESRKKQAVGEALLRRVVLWQAGPDEIACLAREYEQFRTAFGTLPSSEWPTAASTRILHVRPHGRDSTDQVVLPTGESHVRSSFWINRTYLQEILTR